MGRTESIIVFSLSLILILMMCPMSIIAQEEDVFMKEPVVSKPEGIILSAVFPGLGQMSSGHKLKGVTLFIAEVAAAAFLVNAHENYRTRVSIYDSEKNKLYNPTEKDKNYISAEATYQKLKEDKKDLDTLNNIRNTALIIAASIYAVNIIDAVFFNTYRTESAITHKVPSGGRSTIRLSSGIIHSSPGIIFTKTF